MVKFPDPASVCNACKGLIECCKTASRAGLMSGFNGNISSRLTETCALISGSGVPKGDLQEADLLFIDMDGNVIAGSAQKSSETDLHVGLYKLCPSCSVILHTHPRALLALQLALSANWPDGIYELPLFEARIWKRKMAFASSAQPGTIQLSQNAQEAYLSMPHGNQTLPLAIWLADHGLCALATSFRDALAISLQLEHLASLQLDLLNHKCASNQHLLREIREILYDQST